MDFSEYISGKYQEQFRYKSFSPTKVNHEWTWNDEEIDSLINEANEKLSELKMLSSTSEFDQNIIDLFIGKEAVSSCRLEGSKITLGEYLHGSGLGDKIERDDVLNYINAVTTGLEELRRLPLSTRVLNQMHIELMNSDRGEKKTPGEFRKSQNWVGGKTLSEAIYVPPAHEELGELIRDLEYFIHNDEINIPNLIKLAIVHYQFFAIHPYLDGNGKLNRLLVTLFLHGFKMVVNPVLVLSEVLEKSKTEYLVKLNAVRERNSMIVWIKFFLKSVIGAADTGILRMKNISESLSANEDIILAEDQSQLLKLSELIFSLK